MSESEQVYRLLVVDDVVENIDLVRASVNPHFKVAVATSGTAALEYLSRSHRPDVILLDVMMPGLNGFQTLEALRRIPQMEDVPVIFVTAMHEVDDELFGLNLGAIDYIHKPFKPALLNARLANVIELHRAREFLKHRNSWLHTEVQRHLQDEQLVQDVSLRALASLAEARDNETGNHILRTQHYVKILALHLREMSNYRALLNDEYIDILFKAAPLHDIGKVGIPDHILLKPGKLTDEEFVTMQTHVTIGAEALERAIVDVLVTRQLVENPSDALADIRAGLALGDALPKQSALYAPLQFLLVARDISLFHHEKWDGSGYPQKRKGLQIPLSAQLMALADVFDALICKRCYKPAYPLSEVIPIIHGLSGKQFNPDIIQIFTQCQTKFEEVARQYEDGDEHG